jgi:hypothetical protein
MDAWILKNGGQNLNSMNASTKKLCLALFRMIQAGTDGTRRVVDIDLHASTVVPKDNGATSGIVLDFLVTMRGREGPHFFESQHHSSSSTLLID